jgi:hypothetical protein
VDAAHEKASELGKAAGAAVWALAGLPVRLAHDAIAGLTGVECLCGEGVWQSAVWKQTGSSSW